LRHARAAYLRLSANASSACARHCPRWWPVSRWRALDRLSARLFPARTRTRRTALLPFAHGGVQVLLKARGRLPLAVDFKQRPGFGGFEPLLRQRAVGTQLVQFRSEVMSGSSERSLPMLHAPLVAPVIPAAAASTPRRRRWRAPGPVRLYGSAPHLAASAARFTLSQTSCSPLCRLAKMHRARSKSVVRFFISRHACRRAISISVSWQCSRQCPLKTVASQYGLNDVPAARSVRLRT
jgi:hypothetical protein